MSKSVAGRSKNLETRPLIRPEVLEQSGQAEENGQQGEEAHNPFCDIRGREVNNDKHSAIETKRGGNNTGSILHYQNYDLNK